uniref:Uncharacterized protein n=1 Tax=Ursus maritimus TaxID=29073 RepID=A0A452UWN0_URSMA
QNHALSRRQTLNRCATQAPLVLWFLIQVRNLPPPPVLVINIMKYNVFLDRHFTKCIMQRLVLG